MLKKVIAFTLAEFIIVVGVLGVVAEMTVPVLINNSQKRYYVTSLKKAYSEIGQIFTTYIADEGVSDLSQTKLFTIDEDHSLSGSAARAGVMDDILKKYFKVTKTCHKGDSSCSIAGTYLMWSPPENTEFPPALYNFCSADGMCFGAELESSYWCKPNDIVPSSMKGICGEIYVDVNGAKPPNKMGRDFFPYFVIGPDGSLHPLYGQAYAKFQSYWDKQSCLQEIADWGGDPAECEGYNWDVQGYYWQTGTTNCGSIDKPEITIASGYGCMARIIEENWEMNY